MTETKTNQLIEKRVVLDLDRCIECKSCLAACYYWHQEIEILNFVGIGPALLPLVCRQCTDPACVEACPAEAMVLDERGIVSRAMLRCRGCGSCVGACPFGVLSIEMIDHHVAKCDLCADRMEQDKPPRCVAVCPTGALRFETPEQTEAQGMLVLGGRVVGDHPIRRR